MLIDNINFLRKNYRSVREYFRQNESNLQKEPVQVVNAKSGSPTLQVESNGKFYYLHSKYNPEQEAEQIVGKYEDDVSQYDHVFFYGLGLGYHVEAFLEKHPDIDFTLYEPVPANFYHYMCYKKIDDLPLRRLKNLFVETSVGERLNFLNQFAGQLNGNVLLVVLPSYERLYPELYKGFINDFKEHVRNQRSALHTDLAFEKRWTFNSVMNFPEVLKTPNILHDVDKDIFKDKPAIIVSAGPSLNEELENLRYIKENGLAYIFAVGSANKTLIKNNIYPDAVCTYDPQGRNVKVYEEIISQGIDSIPMIFGSSVGFETVERYPGPKLHMITSQDTVAAYILQEAMQNKLEIVNDAPSIAVVTFQMLAKLHANPIIFVGQNLAYKGDYFYSKGIEYDTRKNTIDEKEKQNALIVKDVNGKEIRTNETFNSMRINLESYIAIYKDIEVINTTSGGAHIHGSKYIPLSEVIKDRLKEPIVNNEWYKIATNQYNLAQVNAKLEELDYSFKDYQKLLKSLVSLLKDIDEKSKVVNPIELERYFQDYDHEFKAFSNNLFFKTFIRPMVRVAMDITNKKVQAVRFDRDKQYKAQVIVNAFGKLINQCFQDTNNIFVVYQQMRHRVQQLLEKTRFRMVDI